MNDIEWHEILEAYYGVKLWDRMPAVWWNELGDLKASNEEIIEAIKMAAGENTKPVERKATVRDLRKWIKIYRASEGAEMASGDRRVIIDGIVASMREKRFAGAERGDIVDAIDAEAKRSPWIKTKVLNEIGRRVFGD